VIDVSGKPAGSFGKIVWVAVAVLSLWVLLVGGYKAKVLMNKRVSATAGLDANCDLRQGKCTSTLPSGGYVSFSIIPEELPILRPLTLEVVVDGVSVSDVEVDFVGVDMDMGYNRSTLDSVTGNHFSGDAVLPVCVRSKMDWEARVMMQTDDGVIVAPFRFYTLK